MTFFSSLYWQESRLLRMSPGSGPAEGPGLNPQLRGMGLHEQIERSRYAFDRVHQRVDQYEKHVQALAPLVSPDEQRIIQGLQGRIRAILPPGYNPDAQYNAVHGQQVSSAARVHNIYNRTALENISVRAFQTNSFAQDTAAQLERRVSFDVQKLEAEYAAIEQVIANIESQIRVRNGGSLPPALGRNYRDMVMEQRDAALNAQINAQDQGSLLRTIQVDGYTEPFTGRVIPAYYLLRIPDNANISLLTNGQEVPVQTEQIQLSGGAKFLRLSVALVQSVNPATTGVRLQKGSGETHDGQILKLDPAGNLFFKFGAPPPQRLPDPPPQVEQKRKVEQEQKQKQETSTVPHPTPELPPKPEITPGTPRIGVSPIAPMYTGGRGAFLIGPGFGSLEPVNQAALATQVLVGGRELRPNSAFTDPGTGVVLRRNSEGQVSVLGTKAAELNVEFRRGDQTFNRLIKVKEISVSPSISMHINDKKEFAVSPLDQTAQTAIKIGSHVFGHNTESTDPATGITIDRRNNKIVVSGDREGVFEATFGHGLQAIRRTITIENLFHNVPFSPAGPNHGPVGAGAF